MRDLPANLPSVANAKLPRAYESAREALTACSQIDECQDWADKAAALASYARQAEDDSLLKTATRIQARAIRRCGELLAEIKPAKGGQPFQEKATRAVIVPSRTQAARDAGLSERQQKTALRVAAVPEVDFEAAVESEDPPTVTELAERGTKKQPKPWLDLDGRDPSDFQVSTEAHGLIRRLAELGERISPATVARGTLPKELVDLTTYVRLVQRWTTQLLMQLEGRK